MAIDFPGYSGPTAGTEAPLEMLAACHIRIESRCSTLQKLVDHLKQHGNDEQARSAASGILRYFDTAAVQHHEDEEQDLFPALIESMAGSDAVCIRGITDGLAADHQKLEALWQRLRATLISVAAGDEASLSSDAVDAFVDLYARHLRYEEDHVFPMAARLLGDKELDLIGRAMRKRRGIADDQI